MQQGLSHRRTRRILALTSTCARINMQLYGGDPGTLNAFRRTELQLIMTVSAVSSPGLQRAPSLPGGRSKTYYFWASPQTTQSPQSEAGSGIREGLSESCKKSSSSTCSLTEAYFSISSSFAETAHLLHYLQTEESGSPPPIAQTAAVSSSQSATQLAILRLLCVSSQSATTSLIPRTAVCLPSAAHASSHPQAAIFPHSCRS
ncbi:unnamed protein product [Pleuronectes platessa]|uniref:Uncharacterized protein n=1 Tax=Pleuronectes platessa TaxID=8262 RepID=A0A9N7YLE5_PLEPL|nr:unnamed protein product [Pleuronectes platessa]